MLDHHVASAMAHPTQPQLGEVERPVKRPVATFRTCADLGKAHSFPLPTDFSTEDTEATIDLLERAGQKLAFRPADLVAWSVDQSTGKTAQQFCKCGGSSPQADCLKALGHHLHQMVADQQRKGQPILLHIKQKSQWFMEDPSLKDLKDSNPSETLSKATPPAPPAPPAPHAYSHATHSAVEQKMQKQSPKDLRLQAQGLWATLEKAKVYIPPLDAEKSQDKFHLERHGHGRGNTKSTKKRRKREDRHDLCWWSQLPRDMDT